MEVDTNTRLVVPEKVFMCTVGKTYQHDLSVRTCGEEVVWNMETLWLEGLLART